MNMENYEKLRELYPEYISLDQFYRICKIAKRSALYLVEHQLIPVIDSGKKTWRYKIAIDDVITYLYRREQLGSMIPPGAVTSRKSGTKGTTSARKSFSQMITPGQEYEVGEYFNFIYADCADILTTVDIAEMTGLNRSTVMKLAKDGYIKSIADTPKYLIPKQYLMEFVVSRRFLESKTKSKYFIKILGGFEIWKAAKSSR